MTDQWIVIPNWDGDEEHEGFQHYKDRDPIWIKNYRALLSKEEYICLSFHVRGILHGLWLEYAASNRQIRDNTLTLTRRLGQRVSTRDLKSLSDAGLIEFSASAPLAPCYPRIKIKSKKKILSADAPVENPGGGAAFASRVASESVRDFRPYHPPRDPATSIRDQVRKGIITDHVTLDAEIVALKIADSDAVALRAILALLPTREAA